MSRRRQKANDLARLAADSGPEDGGDPKKFHERARNPLRGAGRKAKQLCDQVRDALLSAMAACGDPAVQAAAPGAVQPAPHTGRLQVAIIAPPDVGRERVAEAVERAAGHLRSEVARAIHRRYAPELVFVVFET